MNKIAATVKTDFNLANQKETITQIYITQDIKRGFYIVHDHPETSEMKGNRISRNERGIGEVLNVYERTIVLSRKEEFEEELKKSADGLQESTKAVESACNTIAG